jgi:hypothetical protein
MMLGDGFGCSGSGSGMPWYTFARFGGGSSVAMFGIFCCLVNSRLIELQLSYMHTFMTTELRQPVVELVNVVNVRLSSFDLSFDLT